MNLSDLNVSRETLARLRLYETELLRWQKSINLISPQTIGDAWSRHFLDSLQLTSLIPPTATRLADLGSGAGFPGLVLAIAHERPGFRVTLVESNAKKAAFLRHVIHATGAPAEVAMMRIEAFAATPPALDVVTARALAPLPLLLDWAQPLLKSGAVALFQKGRDLANELDLAARSFTFRHEVIPSRVADASSILKVWSVERIGTHP